MQVERLEQRDLLTTLALTGDPIPASSSTAPDQVLAAEAAPLVRVRAEVTDLAGQRLTSLHVGQEFRLSVYMDDLRTALSHPGGVFAGYVTVGYQAGLVAADPRSLALDRFWSMATTRDLSTPGLITAGGATTSFVPPGGDEQLLWTATLKATAAGTVTFDTAFTSRKEFLLYGIDELIGPTSIRFESLAIAIHDAPQPPAIVIGQGFAVEGRAGTTELRFQVSLNGPTDHPVTVAYTTQDATAEAGRDYRAAHGTLTFLPGGSQTQWVTVLVDGDQTREPDETFRLVLHDPSGATILGPNFGLGVIQDDDQKFFGDPAQAPVSEPTLILPPVTQWPVLRLTSPPFVETVRFRDLYSAGSFIYGVDEFGNTWLLGYEVLVPEQEAIREQYYSDLPRIVEWADRTRNPFVSTGTPLPLDAVPSDASAGGSETGGSETVGSETIGSGAVGSEAVRGEIPLAFALTVASNRPVVVEPGPKESLLAPGAGDERPADHMIASFDAYLVPPGVGELTSPTASGFQAGEHDDDWLDEILAGMDLL